MWYTSFFDQKKLLTAVVLLGCHQVSDVAAMKRHHSLENLQAPPYKRQRLQQPQGRALMPTPFPWQQQILAPPPVNAEMMQMIRSGINLVEVWKNLPETAFLKFPRKHQFAVEMRKMKHLSRWSSFLAFQGHLQIALSRAIGGESLQVVQAKLRKGAEVFQEHFLIIALCQIKDHQLLKTSFAWLAIMQRASDFVSPRWVPRKKNPTLGFQGIHHFLMLRRDVAELPLVAFLGELLQLDPLLTACLDVKPRTIHTTLAFLCDLFRKPATCYQPCMQDLVRLAAQGRPFFGLYDCPHIQSADVYLPDHLNQLPSPAWEAVVAPTLARPTATPFPSKTLCFLLGAIAWMAHKDPYGATWRHCPSLYSRPNELQYAAYETLIQLTFQQAKEARQLLHWPFPPISHDEKWGKCDQAVPPITRYYDLLIHPHLTRLNWPGLPREPVSQKKTAILRTLLTNFEQYIAYFAYDPALILCCWARKALKGQPIDYLPNDLVSLMGSYAPVIGPGFVGWHESPAAVDYVGAQCTETGDQCYPKLYALLSGHLQLHQ